MDKKMVLLFIVNFSIILISAGIFFIAATPNLAMGIFLCVIPLLFFIGYLILRKRTDLKFKVNISPAHWMNLVIFTLSFIFVIISAGILHNNTQGPYKLLFFVFLVGAVLMLMFFLGEKERDNYCGLEYKIYKPGIMAAKFAIYAASLGVAIFLFGHRQPYLGTIAVLIAVAQTMFLVKALPCGENMISEEVNQINTSKYLPAMGLLLISISFFLLVKNMLLPALIVFIPSAFMLSKTKTGGDPELKDSIKFDTVFLIVFTLAAFLIRMYRIGGIPAGVSFDEGIAYAAKAAQILNGAPFEMFFPDNAIQVASLYYYILAGFSKIFGLGIVQARAMSAVVGALTVPAMYLLAREIFGRRVGLIAAVITCFAYIHITYSRMAWLWIFVPFIAVLGFWMLVKALKTGKNEYFVLSGLLTGLNIYFYNAAKLAPFVIVFYILAVAIASGGFLKSLKRNIPGLIILSLSAFAVFVPLLDYIVHHTADYFNRVNDQSLINFATLSRDLSAVATLLAANFVEIMLMFTNLSNPHGYFNLEFKPLFSPAASFFILVGAGFALFNWRKKGNSFVLIWIFVSLIACYFSTHGQGPKNTQRAILAIQGLIMLAALGADVIWSVIERMGRKVYKKIGAAVVAVLFVFGAVDDLDTYFNKYANSDEVKSAFYYIGITAEDNPFKKHIGSNIYITNFIYGLPSVQNLVFDVPNKNIIDVSLLGLSNYYGDGKKPAFVYGEGIYCNYFGIYKEYFPDAVVEIKNNLRYEKSNKERHYTFRDLAQPDVFHVTCTIPHSDIQKIYGLTLSEVMSDGTVNEKQAGPVFNINNGAKKIELKGLLDIKDYGRYSIMLEPKSAGEVLVDGVKANSRELYQGLHRINISITDLKETRPISIMFVAADNANRTVISQGNLIRSDKIFGLVGDYSSNGKFLKKILDPVIDHRYYYFNLRGLNTNQFDVKWTGTFNPGVEGTFEFSVQTPFKASVIINGEKVFERFDAAKFTSRPAKLNAKGNQITVMYHYASTAELFRDPSSFVRFTYGESGSGIQKPVPYKMLSPR